MSTGQTGTIVYNPNDPVQTGFLAALAQGETGGAANSAFTGVGGANLSGVQTDATGFPIWNGSNGSHAAGTFQFQPSTWDPLATQYGLNFQNPNDQAAGAWYEAQQTYAAKTGGNSLEAALASGNYSDVQSALSNVWPSVTGNGAAPAGLAADLSAALGNGSGGGSTASNGTSGTANANTGVSSGSSGGLISDIENFFVRGGLIIVGGIVVLVALWLILSDNGVIPSPADVGKGLTTALTV